MKILLINNVFALDNSQKVKKIKSKAISYTERPDTFELQTKGNSYAFQQSNVSFQAKPWRLDIGALEHKARLSGEEAIKIFKNFKLGNYLDLDGGKVSGINTFIRRANLAFLDRVDGIEEKRKFIDHYKQLTGFPNLNLIARRIIGEFKNAVRTAELNAKSEVDQYSERVYDVLDFGYNGVSSVSRNRALPGADLNNAYIVLRGYDCDYQGAMHDDEIIEKFKSELWKSTDQRILSYNHDADSFPKVYTERQVRDLISHMDKAEFSSITKVFPPFGILEAVWDVFCTPNEPDSEYDNDFIRANEFFINICKRFPVAKHWRLDTVNPSRENIYTFGYVLEAMKRGKHFKDHYNYNVDVSSAARLLNCSQIFSQKNYDANSEMHAKIEELCNNFEHWSIDKQFDFIKSMILASCGEQCSYPQYFDQDTEGKIKSLMQKIGIE